MAKQQKPKKEEITNSLYGLSVFEAFQLLCANDDSKPKQSPKTVKHKLKTPPKKQL